MNKQTLEKIFFIFINLISSTAGLFGTGLLIFTMVLSLIAYLDPENHILTDSHKELLFIIIVIVIALLFTLFKGIAFLILYLCKKQFPYIHSFFDRLRTDRKFMWIILGIALLLDFIGCKICLGSNFFMMLGLTVNYLIFLLFFHPVKMDRIMPDGTIIDSKLANTIAKIVIVLCITFIIIHIFLIFGLFRFFTT